MVAVNLRHGTIELWDLKQKRSLTSTRPHADTCAMVDVSRSIQLEDFHRPAAVGSQEGNPMVSSGLSSVCLWNNWSVNALCSPKSSPRTLGLGLVFLALTPKAVHGDHGSKIRQVESSLSHSQDSGRAWLFADPMAPNDADHVWSCFIGIIWCAPHIRIPYRNIILIHTVSFHGLYVCINI